MNFAVKVKSSDGVSEVTVTSNSIVRTQADAETHVQRYFPKLTVIPNDPALDVEAAPIVPEPPK